MLRICKWVSLGMGGTKPEGLARRSRTFEHVLRCYRPVSLINKLQGLCSQNTFCESRLCE